MKRLFLLLLLVLAPVAGVAQPQLRTLEVPPRATWQHAETELRLPPTIAGADRVDIRDSTSQEMDIIAAYGAIAGGEEATVYLYRSSLPDTALWFDRALAVLQLRSALGRPAGAPQLERFTPPGHGRATGLLATLDLQGQYRSTGLLVAPVAPNWLLKIRITSARLGAVELRTRLESIARGIQWPAPEGELREPTLVVDCPEPLRLRRARVNAPDMGDALIAGLMGAAATVRVPDAATAYCRDPGATLEFGVYRSVGSSDSYILTLGDSGIAASLGPAVTMADLDAGERRRGTPVSMTLLDRARAGTWPNFDRLPPPQQALQALRQSGPMVSASTDGRNRRQEPAQPGK